MSKSARPPMTRHFMLCTGLVLALPIALVAQEAVSNSTGPFPGRPVLNAPFSAEATTIMTWTPSSGTRTDATSTAHYYRDAAGRARVEYEAPVAPTATTLALRRTVAVIMPDPTSRLVIAVDAATRTVRQNPRDVVNMLFNGWQQFAIPIAFQHFRSIFTWGLDGTVNGSVESLGERLIEGVLTTGRRITDAEHTGQVDERWESAALGLVLSAHHFDPSTGLEVNYQLRNIRQTEPGADLFVVPDDYTLVTQGPPPGQPGDQILRIGFPQNEKPDK